MNDHIHLPTWSSGAWSVTKLKDSLTTTLTTDVSCRTLKMFFFAVTNSGWDQIRESILQWKSRDRERSATLYVGTDHAITDPTAIRRIRDDGVDVRVMMTYQGVFHPKVVWLRGDEKHLVWVGSNNLTRDGLLNNIEFAVIVESTQVPDALHDWAMSIEAGSADFTEELLKSYARQRQSFEARRAEAKTATFTWKMKTEPKTKSTPPVTASGSLIVEVMPRETGSDGRQLQIPIAAASSFFDVQGIMSTREVMLQSSGAAFARPLTMTVFRNNTVRISIGDLEYRDRPCVIVFRKHSKSLFVYEIVPQSIFPRRYKSLLSCCTHRTRTGSRRWGVA